MGEWTCGDKAGSVVNNDRLFVLELANPEEERVLRDGGAFRSICTGFTIVTCEICRGLASVWLGMAHRTCGWCLAGRRSWVGGGVTELRCWVRERLQRGMWWGFAHPRVAACRCGTSEDFRGDRFGEGMGADVVGRRIHSEVT
jgi:hypothetical protein